MDTTPAPQRIRIDKWLWAARFFKTRGLAQTAIDNGRVLIDGERVKAARAVHLAEVVTLQLGDVEKVVIVKGVSERRGPAEVAQKLYEETAGSIARRAAAKEEKALSAGPVPIIKGRPTKRDRRQLERWTDDGD